MLLFAPQAGFVAALGRIRDPASLFKTFPGQCRNLVPLSVEDMNLLEQSFIRADDVIARDIAGETIIVPVRSRVGDLDSIYALNDVGSRIWQLIEASVPVRHIIETVCEEYETDSAEATQDVLELLGSLTEAGLVRVNSFAEVARES
jgi:hypothetical protein